MDTNQEEFKNVYQFLESKILKWKASWYTVEPEEIKNFCDFFSNLPEEKKSRLKKNDPTSFFSMLFVEVQCWPSNDYQVEPTEILSLCDAWRKHKKNANQKPKPACIGVSTCGWCGPECPSY